MQKLYICFLSVFCLSLLGADTSPQLSILGKKRLEKNLAVLDSNLVTVKTNLETIEKNVEIVQTEMVKMDKLLEESKTLIKEYTDYLAHAKTESQKNNQAKEKIRVWKKGMLASAEAKEPRVQQTLSQADEEMNNRLAWDKAAGQKVAQAQDLLGELTANQQKIKVQKAKLGDELRNWKKQAKDFRAELKNIEKRKAEQQKILAEYK